MTDEPADCYVCTRHAIGIGVGKHPDNKWLCKECLMAIDDLTRIRRPSAYELKALDGGVDAVGEYIDALGGKTELADFDEHERRMLVKAAWQGCADELRRLVKNGEAPF